jgi:hypothetical protein
VLSVGGGVDTVCVLSVGREWIQFVCCQSVGSGYCLCVVSRRNRVKKVRYCVMNCFAGMSAPLLLPEITFFGKCPDRNVDQDMGT